jgi:aryl-alcohol dehydrogenase-like predicted oxidoreductase
MHTRTLGQGLEVSAIGLGAMGMSQSYGPNPGDRHEMIAVLRGRGPEGVTFFDTAEVYGPYVNEELVGEALAPIRDEVVIATKFGWASRRPESCGLDSRPEQIRRVADESLKRLRTETIDLFYQHRVDPTSRSRMSPVLSASSSPTARSSTSGSPRQRPGRSAALTRCTRSPRCRASTRCGPVTPSRGAPDPGELGIGFVPFSPLGKGFLTGTVEASASFTGATSARRVPRFTSRTSPPTRSSSTTSAPREAKDATPSQVALAWLLAQQPWIVPIPGTRRTERIRENAAATRLALSADERADLDSLAHRIGVRGDRYNTEHMAYVNR